MSRLKTIDQHLQEGILRLYRREEELGPDGYPHDWHRHTQEGCDGDGCAGCGYAGSIKSLIRSFAGDRCIRCGHPYIVGQSAYWEDGGSNQSPTAPGDGLFDAPEARQLARTPRAVCWSPCDDRCTHGGPLRSRYAKGTWTGVTDNLITADYELNGGAREVQAAWRILTVHHLDGVKANCRWDNLAALCQRCHLHIQKKVQMAQMWPFEHSPWFKPYAAAYYARMYLGEELTRPETMNRLDELLALERLD